ncbi:aminotransferase class I/II-fold pyridoxal phosphate-dependent enzyme [Pontibacter sp. E15-1]|uniref:pyridoxal phosphate-dependent aminotransferase n=1 Tax=Pontibacter sp. E15-1 TaxID=2919918 RepID=UPI001F4FA330|nr:aminotransferase class I/II-fold pyridoxal phosphate-dependent enzyme [Pontibacter sp. E15-1]MCJ8164856.1 aminotransferase class I/II-fold pyridoxal phosphate-dependent enzyme [Pontibacter sp. E15-1]
MIIPKAARLQHVQEYYFARKLAEVRALAAQGKKIINLGIGNPDQLPSAATVEALHTSAAGSQSHGYQSYTGIPALRQAMAHWYGHTYTVPLTEAEVLPLMGSKEGIVHISMAFLNPGDKALVPNPGYPAYASATRLAGAEPVSYTLSEENGWLPQEEELERLVQEGGVKLLWINYPHMPTGTEATAHMLERLVTFAQKHQILLINDNPYSLVLPNQAPLSLLGIPGAKECCLELNSLSKSHNMAGWRVGMVLGAPEYLATILAVKSNMDSGMFLPVQEAAVEALQNDSAWHAARNEVYGGRKVLAHQLLDELKCVYQPDTVGMFVWARVPDTITDVEAYLDEILYEAGVFITPGKIFGTQGERYLRVSLCVAADQLEEAIKRIKHHNLQTIHHELK